MQRSVGAVCLLSVNPRPEVATKEDKEPSEGLRQREETADAEPSSDSDESINLGVSDESTDFDEKRQSPLSALTQNVSTLALSTPRCSNRRFDRSRIDFTTLTMSVAPESLEPVLQCEVRRPLSFKAIVHLHLSFMIDVPFTMVQPPSDDATPTRESRPRRHQSLVRTPSRMISRAFSRRSRSCDEGDDAQSSSSPTVVQTMRLHKLAFVVQHLRCGEERLRTKGLFRISGNANRVRDLTHRLLQEEPDTPLCLDGFSVHDVACSLKAALTGLQPSLIPSDLHPLFAQVVQLTAPRTDDRGVVIPFAQGDLELLRTKQQKSLRLLLLLLDRPCRRLLMDLLGCLKAVSEREEFNCLNDNALAILFGPVLFRIQEEVSARDILIYNQAVELLLGWFPSVFDVPICVLEPMTRALESPDNDLEHASSVSYVQRTKKENIPITEYALSELYAHIASMPDSAKKRRFIKQVSNRNGGIVSPNSPSVAHVERAHATSSRQMCL